MTAANPVIRFRLFRGWDKKVALEQHVDGLIYPLVPSKEDLERPLGLYDADFNPIEFDPAEETTAEETTKADARTLYVGHPLLNASAVRAWAASQGIASALPAGDMHATVAFSREPVDWSALAPEQNVITVMDEDVEKMNPNHDQLGRFAEGPGGGGAGLVGEWTDTGRGTMVAYHGTIDKNLKSIVKNGFVVKRVGTKENFVGERGQSVFFTNSEDRARDWAASTASWKYQYGKAPPAPAVLKLEIPKDEFKFFKPDEKTGGGADAYTSRKIKTEWIVEATVYGADDLTPTNITALVKPEQLKPIKRVSYKKSDFRIGYLVLDLLANERSIKKRAVHQFPPRNTPNGALVLKFESPELAARWQELRDAGASWDFPEYQPHITITYSVAEADVGAIEPYRGPLIFGPEEFAEVSDDWAGEVAEEPLSKMNPNHDERGRFAEGPGGGGGGNGGSGGESSSAAGEKLSDAEENDVWGWTTGIAYGKLRGSPEFTKTLEKFPQFEGMVYRGLTLKPEQLAKLKEGTSYKVSKHSSASSLSTTAEDYVAGGSGEPVLLQIEQKTGRQLPRKFNADSKQQEVILMKGSRFKIKSVSRRDKLHIVVMREVG